jgi:hypothetical protein
MSIASVAIGALTLLFVLMALEVALGAADKRDRVFPQATAPHRLRLLHRSERNRPLCTIYRVSRA